MSLEYIRNTYRVPAWRGGRVTYRGQPRIITGANGPHVAIRLDGAKHALPYHPTDPDLVYCADSAEKTGYDYRA